MKKLLFMLCAALCVFTASAQNRVVKPVEVEIGAGMTFGSAKLTQMRAKNKIGTTAFAEVRYNFAQIPIDLGVRLAGTMFNREELDENTKIKFKSGNIMAVADVNIFRKSNFSLFAGIGAGYALLDKGYNEEGIYNKSDSKSTFCYMPRAGVELWHHVRVTVSYIGGDKANRHLNLGLGIAFGGGRAK